MSDPSNSVRVQLRTGDRERLDEIALRFSCIYGGKPSLSILLSDIASGRIQLAALNLPKKQKREGVVIQLVLILPFYFKGIIYLITDSISNSNGNILELNTTDLINSDGSNFGIVNLLVQISSHKSIPRLIEKLNDIPLEHLREFNTDKDREIDNLEHDYFYQLKHYSRKSSKDLPKSEMKLIFETKCTLGLTIKLENKVGIASNITKKIAEENILISHMNVRQDEVNKGISFIDLHLFFDPSSGQKVQQGLENIENIKNSILGIKGIENVENLDVLFLPKNNTSSQPSVYFNRK
jgi:hypothetical protein